MNLRRHVAKNRGAKHAAAQAHAFPIGLANSVVASLKFEFHRRPGDRHIHFFGADARSASETACGWKMAT